MTQIAVGSQIYQYEVVGAESKLTPVLILHGWGRTGTEWVAVAKKINEWSGRQVYILDLPGFGGVRDTPGKEYGGVHGNCE